MPGMGKPGNLQTWVYSLGPDTWFAGAPSGSTGGGGSGDSMATYVLISATGSLPNSRVLQGRGNIRTLDGGAGSNIVLVVTGAWTDYGNSLNTSASVSIDPLGRRPSIIGTNVVFFVSGGVGSTAGGRTVFGGDVLVSGSVIAPLWGFSGSHTTLADGTTPAFLGGGGIVVSTNSLGQVTFVGTGGGGSSTTWTDANNRIYTTSSVAIDGASGNNTADFYGTDVFFYVSGTRGPGSTKKSVFGGDAFVSGSVTSPTAFGFTGSLTRTTEGNPYIIGIGAVGITTNSIGQVIVSSSGGSSTGTSNIVGTYAARGAAGAAGRLFFGSDTVVGTWLDDGAGWRPMINGIPGVETPLSATLTGFNQGATLLTQYSGSLELQGVNDGTTATLRGYTSPIGSSSFTAFVEVALAPNLDGAAAISAFSNMTLMMRESSSAKAYTWGITARQGSNTPTLVTFELSQWTNNTTRGTINAVQYAYPTDGNAPVFLRIRRDNTSIYADVSRDRRTWKSVANSTLASIFTSFPDQVGIGGFGFNIINRMHVLHWRSGSL